MDDDLPPIDSDLTDDALNKENPIERTQTVHRDLYHFPFDPPSRLVRIVLNEKKLGFNEIVTRYWQAPEALLRLNPSGLLPVLVESDATSGRKLSQKKWCESRAILDYLDSRLHTQECLVSLLPDDSFERAEALRLVSWLEKRFDFEVNSYVLHEKMEKQLMGLGPPDMGVLRQGREALRAHLLMFDSLLEARTWLCGKSLSVADFALSAHLSIYDYFDEINWSRFSSLKTWYSAIKSRPSFRSILADRVAGFHPSPHYDELDF